MQTGLKSGLNSSSVPLAKVKRSPVCLHLIIYFSGRLFFFIGDEIRMGLKDISLSGGSCTIDCNDLFGAAMLCLSLLSTLRIWADTEGI